jgi:hypothetical protein
MRTLKSFSVLFVLVSLFAFQTSVYSQEGKGAALETLGAISAAMIYNTYTTIGGIADGYSYEAYKADYVMQLMTEQVGLMDEMVSSYEKLNESGFIDDPADESYILKLIKTCKLLRDEAKYLKAYAETGESSDLDDYDTARKDAWEMISDLLGLEEE